MADTPQNPATAPAPTAGTPASVGTSTEAPATTPAPTPSPALDTLDLSAALRADLEGPAVTAAEQENQGTPPDESTDPLQAELEQESSDTDTPPADETPADPDTEPADDDEADPADTADQDEEPVPKGMENWPKQAVKRIQKQSETIRALREQVAQSVIQIAPTPTSPLADVTTTAALEDRLQMAKGIRQWCKDNPDGGSIPLKGGGTYEVTPEMAQAKLEQAEREIEAYSDRKLYLAEREQAKPWEAAEAVAPGILQAGTREHTFYSNVLKAVPELAAKLPDYELFVACAARGMKQMLEEREGKARYVRYEMKDGKIVAPKPSAAGTNKAAAPGTPDKPAATTQAQPFRPTNQRPPVRAAGAPQSANLAALEARAAQGDESARRQLLRAELAAA